MKQYAFKEKKNEGEKVWCCNEKDKSSAALLFLSSLSLSLSLCNSLMMLKRSVMSAPIRVGPLDGIGTEGCECQK